MLIKTTHILVILSFYMPEALAAQTLKPDSSYDTIAPLIFESMDESRRKLQEHLRFLRRQTDQLINVVTKNKDVQSNLVRDPKRLKAFNNLKVRYKNLKAKLELNEKDIYAYGTDRQVYSAQIFAAENGSEKITHYIHALHDIQTNLFKILFRKSID